MEGISLIGLPNVELFPDPEDPDEVELGARDVWWIPKLDEFVSQEDEEFLGELNEVVEAWFDGGGGATIRLLIVHIELLLKTI